MQEGIRSEGKKDVECVKGGKERGRKTYRVETFIIPKSNKRIYRSTEELDLEPLDQCDKDDEAQRIIPNAHKTDDLKIAARKMKLEELQVSENRGEPGISGFLQSSLNPGDGEVEFVCQNIRDNVGSTKTNSSLEESLWKNDNKREFEEGSNAGSGNLKGIEDREEILAPFSPFDYKLTSFGAADVKLGATDVTNIERSHSYDFLPSFKPGSDLKSIKESCEVSYGSCEELCHHGNKNGCTVAAQSPSQVSEEIFKENWMQRLEFLRRRVSLIRDKEVVLQERERLLLKKEKELRILERLVKEKIQRADLYLKRCTIRNSQNFEDDLLALHPNIFIEASRPSPPPYPEKPRITNEENNPDADSREILSAGSRTSNRSTRSKGSSSNSTRSESSRGEKDVVRCVKDPKDPRETGNTRRQESSKSKTASSVFISGSKDDLKPFEVARSLDGLKDFRRSKWSAYGSWRCRAKPKISYDDLDSTLSADIGDSSFAITSQKLDPRLVRMPRGFARSASERGRKNRPCSLDLDVDLGPEGERVLRKISENISAVTQSQGTRFQDYGSIDKQDRNGERKSEDPGHEKQPVNCFEGKNNAGKDSQLKSRKERTSFWNEEASDWLRKKRQAYNLATKRMANRDYENKENFGNSQTLQTSEKHSKTKNEKGKKFTIFR